MQGGDTESVGCDRGANMLHFMAPQPRSSPCNKFDNLPNLLAHLLADWACSRSILKIRFCETQIENTDIDALSHDKCSPTEPLAHVYQWLSSQHQVWGVVLSERWTEEGVEDCDIAFDCFWLCQQSTTLGYCAIFMNGAIFNMDCERPWEDTSSWLWIYSKNVLLVQHPTCGFLMLTACLHTVLLLLLPGANVSPPYPVGNQPSWQCLWQWLLPYLCGWYQSFLQIAMLMLLTLRRCSQSTVGCFHLQCIQGSCNDGSYGGSINCLWRVHVEILFHLSCHSYDYLS